MKLCSLTPALWLKLRYTSRLFMWRLDNNRLPMLQHQLLFELSLQLMDIFELCERGDAECMWLLLCHGEMSIKARDPGRDSFAKSGAQR